MENNIITELKVEIKRLKNLLLIGDFVNPTLKAKVNYVCSNTEKILLDKKLQHNYVISLSKLLEIYKDLYSAIKAQNYILCDNLIKLATSMLNDA